jgi:hypothetical protein
VTAIDVKPLAPLTHGNVLIVGVKPSNLNDEIREHPRVVLWDSQQQHWTNKELPDNTQAVFITKWIGHAAFERILAEARKRKITIFNQEGTGVITKRVRELLGMDTQAQAAAAAPKTRKHGKLRPLVQFIDFGKTNAENARALLARARELGITSTEHSLGLLVSKQRRKQGGTAKVRSLQPRLDVSVEILDGMIKELQDMREFLVATVDENNALKARLGRFKQVLEGDAS